MNLDGDLYFNDREKCKLKGISNEIIYSKGVVDINLDFGQKSYNQNFNIVDDSFPIQTDGILGQDFLKNCLSKIDLETCTITLVIEDEEVTLPIHSSLSEAFDIIIPARTEVIHRVRLDLNEDSVVFNKEIQEGVFVGNSIVPKDGFVHIKLLNVTDKEVKLKNLNLETEPIKNYYVIKQNKTKNYDQKRFAELIKTLKLDSNDTVAKDSLLKMLEDYFT